MYLYAKAENEDKILKILLVIEFLLLNKVKC